MELAMVYGMTGNLLSTLCSDDVRRIGSAIGVKNELEKLKRNLSSLNSVLSDADNQQRINNFELKDWIKKIKDTCYEADDVLDDFSIEALREELSIRENTFKKVHDISYSVKSIQFRLKMSPRIKEIRQKFDEIVADRYKFNLVTRVVDLGVQNRGREPTHSFVDKSEVFGRDGDKNEIINLLSDGDKSSVVAIIGMGGLGKTTLSRLVYNDKVVDEIFEMRLWVGVYQDFDVKKIFKKIIMSATHLECPDLEMDHYWIRLQELFKGRKFLLVLDDVWSEDSEKLDTMRFVITCGAPGSKVVVTTRLREVASMMDATQYILKGLSDDDCWNLFNNRAFGGIEDQSVENLVVIGKDLAHRCHGVPLAARTLGSLMRLKTTQREWENVRDSDVWKLVQNENDISPTLRLSYNHLPMYLKQCFAYLALYEMDSLYKKNDLIHSWIAHGFVRLSPGDNSSLEDLGNKYVEELLWRSLIQEPVQDKFGNLKSFKVHDLIHNLATDVLGTEFICYEEGIKVLKPEEIRYAELSKCPYSEGEDVMRFMQSLRGLSSQFAAPAADIFSRWKSLRSLQLFVTGESIPSSIGKLKHLRYLKLVCHYIKNLPTSITKLHSLRTLDLNCAALVELPQRIGKMINLKHLCIQYCFSLLYLPHGLKELTSLQTLHVFPVRKGVIGCTLNALKGMTSLGGRLTIENLKNVKNSQESAEANLFSKQNLEVLKLLWNETGIDDNDNDREDISFDVLENLKPHPNLKSLKIEGYSGINFPRWMMDPFLTNVMMVTISKCGKCQYLPPFSQLPLLRVLTLTDLEALQFFEVRVLRRREKWFPSLRTLCLERLPNLENWATAENEGCFLHTFPSLVEVRIHGSPKLKSMPLLPSIETLELCECSAKLVRSSLLQQAIKEESQKSSSPCSSSLPTLKSLHIEECGDLEFLPKEGVHGLSSLESLVIESCPNLISLPEVGLQGLTSLRSLEISNCERLTTLSADMRHLTALQTLKLYKCKDMQSLVGMDGLASLRTLDIQELPRLASFPELQNATKLSSLSIRGCEALESLSESLGNLTALDVLVISSCPQLRSLPDRMQHLIALRELHISECDYLTPRCNEATGEDWSKIAHVRYIKLNLERIRQ